MRIVMKVKKYKTKFHLLKTHILHTLGSISIHYCNKKTSRTFDGKATNKEASRSHSPFAQIRFDADDDQKRGRL